MTGDVRNNSTIGGSVTKLGGNVIFVRHKSKCAADKLSFAGS